MPPPPLPDAIRTVQQKSPADGEKQPKYLPGALIWAKMTGHPYWPCMVTDDPIQDVFTRFNGELVCLSTYVYVEV